MAESNEQPPLCPCGFWGSVQTSGLCSVCYKERQQQNRERDAKLFGSTTAASSSPSPSPALAPAAAAEPCQTSRIDDNRDTTDETETDAGKLGKSSAGVTVEPTEAFRLDEPSGSSTPTACNSANASRDNSPSRPVQKNRKRCFVCKARLELAFVEIGRCKCGCTFCEQHRLPEQHACTYDHKETGRKEARDKMVSPKKHVGTSLRRLDSDS